LDGRIILSYVHFPKMRANGLLHFLCGEKLQSTLPG
jgi:hypothetical protein